MGKKLANFFKGEIISSIFYMALGLCLILIPEETVTIICKVVFGLVMIGAGVYHIYIYVSEKEKATILDLFTGVIVFVLGAFLFFTPQIVVKLLPYLLGAFVLVDSIWKLKGCRKLKKLEKQLWKLFLGVSLVFIALGITVFVYPFEAVIATAVFCGAVLLADGIADLILLLLLHLGLKNKKTPHKEEDALDKEKEVQEAPVPKAGKEDLPEWAEEVGQENEEQSSVQEEPKPAEVGEELDVRGDEAEEDTMLTEILQEEEIEEESPAREIRQTAKDWKEDAVNDSREEKVLEEWKD